MGSININGKIYSGNNICIDGDIIKIDGKEVTANEKEIKIEITGNIQSIKADKCNYIQVNGSVRDIKTMSGDVTCGDVTGNIDTMSGDIECCRINGDVKTMSGDINYY